MDDKESNGESRGTNMWFDRLMVAVNRVGFPTVVVAYFLYKDFTFTRDLVANQRELILTQAQIVEAVRQIAGAVAKIATQ